LTIRLAQAYGLTEEEITHIRRGALLHDMGKIGVPDGILHKPAALSDEE
jgi:HD-GYP domain-containing protein (c-di-GMP phosphodiesterase class II)